VEQAQAFIQREEMEKANGKLKKTVKTIDQFQHVTFNPDSNKHIAILLFNALELSPVNYTPGGAPCTDIASLKDLVKQKPPEDVKALLQDLIALQKARKIESSFIKFFRERDLQRENKSYLVGNLNLGGTKSGRLSSSSPNLQNLPSTNTEYAKPFKQCITPDTRPWPDWLFVGADYSALEDRVSALVSKDPARLNIYEKGVDGHCQNAYAYYKDRMPDINPRDPNSINSISNKYPTLRQASKTITFALLYRATAYGLAQNTDLELPEAQKAFDAYHELYEISKEWSDAKLRQSVQQGYAELAFGLKLRCPVLTQSHTGTSHVTPQAHKETKTLANAFIQSYGLLNTVSVCKFMSRVWYSEYRLDILPCVQIHDAQYYLVRNHIPTLLWLNDNLIECMIEWPELPELEHERVKLEAELDIFWPDWAHPIRIPNNVDEKGLRKAVNLALETRK
jgi:DNA polymerase-1